MKDKFNIEGMTCAACQAHVNKAVSSLDGVKNVEVNLLTNSMVVEYNDSITSDIINDAVSKAGYKSYLANQKDNIDNSDRFEDKETKKLVKRLILSVSFLIPLFYLGMGYMMGWPVGVFSDYPLIFGLTAMLLSLILILINKAFFISGFKSLFHKSPNMDTLVALGSGVAFIYSLIIYFMMLYYTSIGDNMHTMHLSMNLAFETAGMVPTLITVGKMLEAYSKGKTTNALKDLMNLSPKYAHILKDGKEIDILIEEANVGDIFIVKPGEAIPLDGVIINGFSSVDEQALTGESLPVDKEIDDKVFAATINKNGLLTCKATKKSSESTLSKIIEMVEEAGSSKANISKLADKVAGIFVPVVIGIAIIVFTFWLIFGKDFVTSIMGEQTLIGYAIERAIAVLVISCPCALGLATPVAIMVASGKGAKLGILFKNAQAIEEAGKINFVVLDKTGTITKGLIKVTDIYANNISDIELLKYALSIEASSIHPLALAIKEKAKDIKPYDITDFKELPGSGLKAKIDGKIIYALSVTKALSYISFTDKEKEIISKYQDEAKTPLIFIYDDKLIGIIACMDEIKEDSKEAISEFKALGITPVMLSGDNYNVAKNIANEVGIDYFIAEALPNDKQDIIKKLKEKGKVAMIGDGINDAIALKEANIGIAIGAGTDIAKDSADIILVKSSLKDAATAIKLSRVAILNIKENLFWAFFYNLIMIPIAAGALSGVGLAKLKPWYGALAMSLSSFTVVMNALRINLFKKDKKLKSRKLISLDEKIFEKERSNNMELVLNVEGMMCMHCKAHVEKACLSVANVKTAVASLDDKNVVVTYDNEVSKDDLVKAITEAGYTVTK